MYCPRSLYGSPSIGVWLFMLRRMMHGLEPFGDLSDRRTRISTHGILTDSSVSTSGSPENNSATMVLHPGGSAFRRGHHEDIVGADIRHVPPSVVRQRTKAELAVGLACHLLPERFCQQSGSIAQRNKGRSAAPLWSTWISDLALGGLGHFCCEIFFDFFDAFADFQTDIAGDFNAGFCCGLCTRSRRGSPRTAGSAK